MFRLCPPLRVSLRASLRGGTPASTRLTAGRAAPANHAVCPCNLLARLRLSTRASSGGSQPSAAFLLDVELFSAAARHEHSHGYSNTKGKLHADFGRYLVHALGLALKDRPLDRFKIEALRSRALAYSCLTVADRVRLVADCCAQLGLTAPLPRPPPRPSKRWEPQRVAESSELQAKPLEPALELLPDHAEPLLISFDLETTGQSPDSCHIIEIAAMNCVTGEVWSTLVNPGKGIVVSQLITDITNISNAMVKEPDVPFFADILPDFHNVVAAWEKAAGMRPLLVAHNGRSFDTPILVNEHRRAGKEMPPHWRFADSVLLARAVLGSAGPTHPAGGNALGQLVTYFGLPQQQAHRAEYDARMLRDLLGPAGLGSRMPHLSRHLLKSSFAAAELLTASKKPRSRGRW